MHTRVNALLAEGGQCDGMSVEVRSPLPFDPQLRCAARLHAEAMVVQMFDANTGPDGVSYLDRMDASELEYGVFGIVFPTGITDAELDEAVTGFCEYFFDPAFEKVAVGRHEDTIVILLSGP